MFHRILFFLGILFLGGNLSIGAQTPDSAVRFYEHGTSSFQQGDLDGAIADFTKAIEISSRLVPTRSTRHTSLPGVNGFADSAEADGITVIDPFTANAYTSRGLARYRKGDIDEAITDWDRAIRINPGLAAAYLDRGCAQYAKRDAQRAIADWNRALQINPNLSQAYCNRGAARQNLGDTEGALADLNQAIALDPREAVSYCNRGYTWLGKGDFDRATIDLDRKSTRLNSSHQIISYAVFCLKKKNNCRDTSLKSAIMDPKTWLGKI